MDNRILLRDVVWLGHSSLWIRKPLNIYIDPFKIGDGLPKADLILISHSHFDHFSETDIAKLITEDTIVLGPEECVEQIAFERVIMFPGKIYKAPQVKIRGVAAYSPKTPYHPVSRRWVGYWLDLEGRWIYYAGDSWLTPEMGELSNWVDVAFLPIDGVFTMNAEQGFRAVERLMPDLAVPIHYGSICGTRLEASKFVKRCVENGFNADFIPCADRELEDQRIPEVAPSSAGAGQ